jgi:hypothetical protein
VANPDHEDRSSEKVHREFQLLSARTDLRIGDLLAKRRNVQPLDDT